MKKIVFFLILLTTASLNTFAQTAVEKNVDNTKDAVTSLREQIEGAPAAPDRIRLQLKLADLLASKGQRKEALAELQLILDSNAFDPAGFYNLGNSYARLGESEPAINAYRIAIEQRKGRYSRAYNNLGVLLLRNGRWDEAHDALITALKLESFRYAEASYNLGRVYAARGQKDLAAREWRRALLVDPKHDAAALALSTIGTEEKIEVASKPVTAAPKVAAESKPVEVKAVPAAAAPKSLSLDEESFDFLQRARTAAERGKLTEAVDDFRRVLSRHDGYFPPANLELSYALLGLKRYDEALPHLLQVSQRDGARYPISYFHLARLYELKGDLKLAEAAFSQAAPTNAQFLLDVSRVREKLGDYKGALDAMERYLKLMPEQDQKPAFSDQRLAELKRKAGQ
jgi:tetratricopeptide (TPR) repeat protein